MVPFGNSKKNKVALTKGIRDRHFGSKNTQETLRGAFLSAKAFSNSNHFAKSLLGQKKLTYLFFLFTNPPPSQKWKIIKLSSEKLTTNFELWLFVSSPGLQRFPPWSFLEDQKKPASMTGLKVQAVPAILQLIRTSEGPTPVASEAVKGYTNFLWRRTSRKAVVICWVDGYIFHMWCDDWSWWSTIDDPTPYDEGFDLNDFNLRNAAPMNSQNFHPQVLWMERISQQKNGGKITTSSGPVLVKKKQNITWGEQVRQSLCHFLKNRQTPWLQAPLFLHTTSSESETNGVTFLATKR